MRRTAKVLVRHHAGGASTRRPDEVIVEEPLEIRLDDELVSTTMRTPGHDFELGVGFLHAEGLLSGATVRTVRYCGTGSAVETEFNVVSVETDGKGPEAHARLGPVNSACGICGADQIGHLAERLRPLAAVPALPSTVLGATLDDVRTGQELFERTGAVHAAALVDPQGSVVAVREDIGRHNAVDKVTGRLLLDGGLPAGDLALVISGRASFEMVQKAWAAGFGAVVAVSAPSALAVEAAEAAGMQLAGFARNGTLNLYSSGGLA